MKTNLTARAGAFALALGFGLVLAWPAASQTVTTHGLNVGGTFQFQGFKRNEDRRVENGRINSRDVFEDVEGRPRERGEGIFATCTCGTSYACSFVTASTDPVSILTTFGGFAVSPDSFQEGGRDSLVQRSVGYAAVSLSGQTTSLGAGCTVETRYSPLGEFDACVNTANLSCVSEGDRDDDDEGVSRNLRINVRRRSTSVDLGGNGG